MFAPNHEKAASELLRVCKPGGKIGMANWTPDSVIGELFRVTGRHVVPPTGLKPPALWGSEDRLRELFGGGIASLRATKRSFTFRYHSPEHWLEYFSTDYGPTLKAFEALDNAGQEALARDLLDLWRRFNRSSGDTLVAPGDYLEVVATRT
jgi:hypothetical protein